MKLIYIAGAYRADTENGVFENIMKARSVAVKIARLNKDVFAVVPHLNTMFFGGVREDDYWFAGDKEMLSRCDAILLMDGWAKSSGAVAERELARELKLEVLTEDWLTRKI